MNLPQSYGVCLRRIMSAHHITISDLSRKMGFRSSTSLVRILKDETSADNVRKFHERFRLLGSWLITPSDVEQLDIALKYNQLGHEKFLLHSAMRRFFFRTRTPSALYPSLLTFSPALQNFSPHASAPFSSLEQLIQAYEHAAQLDVIMFNAATPEICSAFARLVRFPARMRSIHHYFALKESVADISFAVAAALPLINEPAYEGYYCLPEDAESTAFLSAHSLILVRIEQEAGDVRTHLFVPTSPAQLSVCAFAGSDLYDFYSALAGQLASRMHPLKAPTSASAAPCSLLELTERHLLEESQRAICALEPDPANYCIPTEILRHAVIEGEGIGLSMDHPMIEEFARVHTARYLNIHQKNQPTHLVFPQDTLRRFARTGHQSAHFFGMRDFTPEERVTIFSRLIASCRENPNFHVHMLRCSVVSPEYRFVSFSDLGVMLSSAHSSYDAATHKEAVLTLPQFLESFESYFIDTLIPECCLSQEESLAFLQQLTDELQSAS